MTGNSFPARPVYFTYRDYPKQLGLADYTKRVGLVQKLEPQQVHEDANTVRIGDTFVDVPHSLALWKSYKGATQFLKEGRWIDPGSSGVPLYYAGIGQDLAQALAARGDTVHAQDVFSVVRRVVAVLQ